MLYLVPKPEDKIVNLNQFVDPILPYDPTFRFNNQEKNRFYGDPTRINTNALCRAICDNKSPDAMKISLIVKTFKHQISNRKEVVPIISEDGGSDVSHATGYATVVADASGGLVQGRQVCRVEHFQTQPNRTHALIHAKPGTLVSFGMCDGHHRRMIVVYRVDDIVTVFEDSLLEHLIAGNDCRDMLTKEPMCLNLTLVTAYDAVHNHQPLSYELAGDDGQPVADTKNLINLTLQKLSGESTTPLGVEFFFTPLFIAASRNPMYDIDWGTAESYSAEPEEFFDVLRSHLAGYRDASKVSGRKRISFPVPVQNWVTLNTVTREIVVGVAFNQKFVLHLVDGVSKEPIFDHPIAIQTKPITGVLPWQLVRDNKLVFGKTNFDELETLLLEKGEPIHPDTDELVMYQKLDTHA
jgi:hypothetical protein